MRETVLKVLIIGILSYYLVKGLMFLFMWQGLGQIAKAGKKKKAEQEQARIDKRAKRDQRARDNWGRS